MVKQGCGRFEDLAMRLRERRWWNRGASWFRQGAAIVLLSLLSAQGKFQPIVAQEATAPVRRVREVFVPFEDLNILLEGQTQRIFLERTRTVFVAHA